MSDTVRVIDLFLPAQAAAETEATIVRWFVSEGASFEKNQPLAEVESAKSTFTFEAPCNGRIIAVKAAEGTTVPFEKPVLAVETDDSSMWKTIPHAATPASQKEETARFIEHGTGGAKKPGTISIIGVGGCVPERVVPNSELLSEYPDISADYLFGVTGINERRWAESGELPSDLAYRAARDAMEKAGVTESDLDAIIVTTTTPDVPMPSTACILQKKMNIRGIPAFDLNAACSGWLYGLSIAKALMRSNGYATTLVVGVDRMSDLLDKNDRDTYFLFGDGAGAAVLSAGSNGHHMGADILTADAEGIHMARRHAPGYYVGDTTEGVDPWIRLDGHALFRFATESFASIIRDVVKKNGWEPDSVRWVVPHQANGRILKAAARRCGISFDRFYVNIDHMGNTSSASIPLALCEMERGLQRGDRLVLCSVGAGITAAALSIIW